MSSDKFLSTAARIGSTWRCSSVETMTAVTSGRFKSWRKSVVTKSALVFSLRSESLSCLRSATPMKSTIGWRAATSPRKRPTRPAPTMARPMRLGCFFNRLSACLFTFERQLHRLVRLGREVGSHVDLHDHARVLGRDQHRPVERDGLEEMHRLGGHRAGERMLDELA